MNPPVIHQLVNKQNREDEVRQRPRDRNPAEDTCVLE